MCGRYRFVDELEELRQMAKEANERLFGKSVKTGEVYPSDLAIVAVWEGGKVKYMPVWWGFPKWSGKGVVINARAETAGLKPMFREPLRDRRCVVPSTGFYEWKKKEGTSVKEKFLLTEPGKDILYMAGILNTFTKSDGSQYDAFTILTTAANESVKPLYDRISANISQDVNGRMPVILRRGECKAWLTGQLGFEYIGNRNDIVLMKTAV